jgi:hypothetical protein
MRNLKHCLMAVCVALGLTLPFSSHAQNIFRNETTTAAGYSTWDADLINVEFVPQTGKGVYVAVLDAGLVPNWRDYFPEARVATALGMGFYTEVDRARDAVIRQPLCLRPVRRELDDPVGHRLQRHAL